MSILQFDNNQARSMRFLAHVPAILHADLHHLARTWIASGSTATDVVRSLRRRLDETLRERDHEQNRRHDLQLLFVALGQHERLAIEFVNAVARPERAAEEAA